MCLLCAQMGPGRFPDEGTRNVMYHSSCQGWAPWHPSPTPCSSSAPPPISGHTLGNLKGKGPHFCQNHRMLLWPSRDPAPRMAEVTALGNKAETRLKPVFRGGVQTEPGSWGCDLCSPRGPCTQKGSTCGSMLCCCSLGILNNFFGVEGGGVCGGDPCFHFPLGLANYVMGFTSGSRSG